MSMTAAEIAAVADELAPLAGARVDAVHVHAERALTLELHRPAAEATVHVSAEADLTRIHAVRLRPPKPAVPFPFQAVLRREIEGARLLSIEARPGDRVVEMRFERGGARSTLVAELTGRHGNLFLVGEEGTIRAGAARDLSSRRRLAPGERYAPPPPRPGGDLGQALRFAPAEGGPFPLSAAIEVAYRQKEQERALAEARRRVREPLRAGIARSERALDHLADEARRVPAAEADRRAADLIKANLRGIPHGARSATLVDWRESGPTEVTIALDPALTPRQNMERAYRRYRRIVESTAQVAARQAEVRLRLDRLRALAAELDAAGFGDLERIEREARRLGAAPRLAAAAPARRKAEEPPPYRTFRSAAGGAILVGRSAEANDLLTVRVARGNDLWLHARGRAGAHVVARLERGRGPDQEILLDAAHLAAHFSEARGEPSVEVAYTRAKHVRKPRGAAPGAVLYSQERTMLLRIEPPRLERLLASEEKS